MLKGKVAIVTGAGSGLGRAFALGLAREGASVAVADIAGDRAEAVAEEVAATGAAAMAYQIDVSDSEQADRMVAAVVSHFGGLDILVNNAGRAAPGTVAEMTDEQWDGVVAVNLRGTFVCSRAAVRQMIPRGWGRIVNVASGRGIRGSPGSAVYGATKAAIINFTRSLALEVASHNITVNAIAPGVTDTPFWRANRSQEDIDAVLRSGRIGRPDDLTATLCFLCSEGGGMLTGLTINRDIFVGATSGG